MKEPTISVVAPCYNTASYLGKCLDSLMAQTVKPKEIIVVDDGSTDHPEKIVARYPSVILIRHPKNLGQNAARQAGLLKASGKYVFLADTDSEYHPKCLETLVIPLQKKQRLAFCYADYRIRNENSWHWKVVKAGPYSFKKLQKKNYISNCALYRKKMMLPFDPLIRRYSDWDYFLSLGEKKHFGIYVPLVIFDTIRRAGGISNRGDYDREYWRLRVQEKHHLAPKIAVYSFTWNRLAYTKRTFKGMDKFDYPFDQYVWDNGSTDKTVDWLREYRRLSNNKVTLFLSPQNVGLAVAKNSLLSKIKNKYDYYLKVDNDCDIVSWGILRELIILSRLLGDNALLSPTVGGLGHPVPRHAYFRLGPHVLSPVPQVGGLIYFAPKKFYSNFTGNNAFSIAYEDVEFACYVWRQHGKVYYVEDLEVNHMDTTAGQNLRYPKYFEIRDKALQAEKVLISQKKIKIDKGIYNADFWQEVYRIDKNPRFILASIMYRYHLMGVYNLFFRVFRKTILSLYKPS